MLRAEQAQCGSAGLFLNQLWRQSRGDPPTPIEHGVEPIGQRQAGGSGVRAIGLRGREGVQVRHHGLRLGLVGRGFQTPRFLAQLGPGQQRLRIFEARGLFFRDRQAFVQRPPGAARRTAHGLNQSQLAQCVRQIVLAQPASADGSPGGFFRPPQQGVAAPGVWSRTAEACCRKIVASHGRNGSV